MKLCGFDVGLDKPFFLIAGPCVIESREMALETAAALKDICAELAIPFIYKSSYDKANRSSDQSFRGFGIDAGLTILDKVKKVWMDGEFVDWDDAKVHVLTHGLHYGTGVFEGIRAYDTTRGPAICPSFVTWPMTKAAISAEPKLSTCTPLYR